MIVISISYKINKNSNIIKIYNILYYVCYIFFLSKNIILFFILFETIGLIVIVVILKFGYYKTRFLSTVYFVLYTSLRLFPLLATFIIFYNRGIQTHYLITNLYNTNILVRILLIIGFLVKLPVYPLHLWLLKAHLEAPVEGSIFLAAILLKLGIYGLIRLSTSWVNIINYYLSTIFLPFTLISCILVSLNCIFTQDYKLLVATSSVVHINICLFTSLQIANFGVTVRLIITISHGLASSGLFSIANLLYTNTGRRRFFMCKGLISISTYRYVWLTLLLASNLPTPPSMNLVTEVLSVTALLSIVFSYWPYVLLLCFCARSYFIYFFYMINSTNTKLSFVENKQNINYNIIYTTHLLPLWTFILWSTSFNI